MATRLVFGSIFKNKNGFWKFSKKEITCTGIKRRFRSPK